MSSADPVVAVSLVDFSVFNSKVHQTRCESDSSLGNGLQTTLRNSMVILGLGLPLLGMAKSTRLGT